MDKETKTKDMENIPPPAYPGPPGNNGSSGYAGTSGLPAPPAYTPTYDEPAGSPPGYPSDPPPLYSPAPAIAPLGQKSTRLVCRHCSKEVTTNVESKISRSGLTWAIICCLGGSWIASCLAFCLPGFRRYTHTCPNCGVIIGEVEPKHTTNHKIVLVLSVLLVVGFGGWLIYKYKVYPYNRILKYHHGNSTLFD